MKTKAITKRLVPTAIALLGWFALIAQLVLMLEKSMIGTSATIMRFFSYFTILTNCWVAVYATWLLFKNISWLDKNQGTTAATTMYILVVGIIYNVVLRKLWAPVGLQKLVDELLHSVIPLLFLVFWLTLSPKESLNWKQAFKWLIYPLCYCLYILISGSFTSFYPYPFMDVSLLGLPKVMFNALMVTLVFSIVGCMLVGVGKLFKRSF